MKTILLLLFPLFVGAQTYVDQTGAYLQDTGGKPDTIFLLLKADLMPFCTTCGHEVDYNETCWRSNCARRSRAPRKIGLFIRRPESDEMLSSRTSHEVIGIPAQDVQTESLQTEQDRCNQQENR